MTVLDDAEEVIARLARAGPAELADPEAILRLERVKSGIEAATARAAAAFDASGEWAPDGAKTAASWLCVRGNLAKAEARRQIRRGRHLRSLPAFEEAWGTGEITSAQVDAVCSVRNPSTTEALVSDEGMLCDLAKTLRFDRFCSALAYWEQRADPDGTEDRAAKRSSRREVSLTSSFQGMWFGTITLDPVSGEIVADELSRLEKELFEADWKEAKDSLGHDPSSRDLPRTPAQRRADALVEMATRSKSAPANSQRPAPLFSVLVDFPTLAGRITELASGVVVSPGSLLPFLEEALIERAVFTPEKRVEVSKTARLFTGATRRAIELRDRECTHPCCDGARRCQVDHIVPYAKGGPTTQENGRLLCGFHNRLRNQRPPPAV